MEDKVFGAEGTPEWGVPVIDRSLCSACGLCAGVCPSGSIRMLNGAPVTGPGGKFGCLACGHCTAVCPRKAVRVSGRGMRPDDVLDLPAPGERAGADAVEGLLRARRSMRRYADRPVEAALLDRLLEMAASAPMGFPPSSVGVTVINGGESVRRFAADLVPAMRKWLFLETPPGSVVLRFMMGRTERAVMRNFVLPVAREIIEARAENKDLLFYDAPCVLVFHYPLKDTVDPSIACSFAAVAAEALGLGSCIIGTVAPALRNDSGLKAKWGIPEGSLPSIAMTLGYPAVAFVNGVRRRFSSVTRL